VAAGATGPSVKGPRPRRHNGQRSSASTRRGSSDDRGLDITLAAAEGSCSVAPRIWAGPVVGKFKRFADTTNHSGALGSDPMARKQGQPGGFSPLPAAIELETSFLETLTYIWTWGECSTAWHGSVQGMKNRDFGYDKKWGASRKSLKLYRLIIPA